MKEYIVRHDGIGGRFSKGDTPTDADLRAYLAGRGVTNPDAQQRVIDDLLAGGAIAPRKRPRPRTEATGRKATHAPTSRKAH